MQLFEPDGDIVPEKKEGIAMAGPGWAGLGWAGTNRNKEDG